MSAAILPKPKVGRRLLPRFRGELWIGIAIVVAWVVVAIFASLIANDPDAIHLTQLFQPPSLMHPFGTDQLGRDVFSRVIYGARMDILIAFVGVLAPVIVGVFIGLLSGYFGGWVEALLMRLFDITVAFPFFVLVLVIVGLIGPGLTNLLIALTIVGWVTYARLVRAQVLVIKHAEYILAAKTLGYKPWYIVLRHVLPNAISPVAVYAVTDAVLVMLAGATLGFLGLGVQPPKAEWGVMIANGQVHLVDAWWISFFPGLAAVTFGIGLVAISDALTRMLREAAQ